MGRKSQYDQFKDAIIERLRELDHSQARTIEEAVANEQIVSNAFGMRPSGAEAYDYCPTHPNKVRYLGQCPQCEVGGN